ncbi:MAG: hypothetical protein NZ990_07995 [Myxococcota bacterium]|nr:hypothetical protein [Myxococcota bacterium]
MIGTRIDVSKTALSVIAGLVEVLGVYKPQRRLKRMLGLMRSYGVLPLQGHCAVADLGLAQWLTVASPRRAFARTRGCVRA